jgi:hypothetical protein
VNRTGGAPGAVLAGVGRVRSVGSLLGVLQGLVPLARRLVRGVRLLTVASAAAVAIIVVVPLTAGWPVLAGWIGLGVAAVILGLAPLVLWLFADALQEVLALPGWLRASPAIVANHGGELADLAARARADRQAGRRRRVHVVRDGWRAAHLLLDAHAEVPGYGAALRLISVPFLMAVAVAALIAVFEISLAPVVVLVTLALRVI